MGGYIREMTQMTQEHKQKISESLKGRHLSEETKQKLSEANRGKRCTEETKRKMSEVHRGEKNPMYGKRGKDTPMFGRRGKDTPMFGRRGEKNPMFGKHHSEESKKKNSESHQGRCHSEKTKQKLSKAHLGKRHSKEDLWKMSEALLGEKNPMFGKHHSEETKRKQSEAERGEKASNWQGGISFLPYSFEFNRSLKRLIKQRDNKQCQNPYCEKKSFCLTVHHIDYNKGNSYPLNLITLCRSCNGQANFRRREWEVLYQGIILSNRIRKSVQDKVWAAMPK